MGDESEDDAPTSYAPTELGAAIEETEAVTAWSLDDGEDWPTSRWTPRLITTLALAASLVLLAGAGALAYWSMQRPVLGDVAMLTPGDELTGTAPDFDAETGFPDPPPPPTATVTVERPAPEVVPVVLTALDERFLSTLTGKWGFNIVNPSIAIQNAALVCQRLRSGIDLPEISQEMAAATEYDVRSAHIFASEVLLTYPTCHMP